MKIKSIQISKIKKVEYQNKTVETGFFKKLVDGPVSAAGNNIVGDEQADHKVHGGEHKAIYSYAIEHYDYWKKEISRDDWANGMFGENLTTSGLDEKKVNIGDQFQIGKVVLEAAQPRLPCYKLGIRFDDPKMVKKFFHSDRYGIYYKIIKEGKMKAGDNITQVSTHPAKIKVYDLISLFDKKKRDIQTIEKLSSLDILAPSLKTSCREILSKNEGTI